MRPSTRLLASLAAGLSGVMITMLVETVLELQTRNLLLGVVGWLSFLLVWILTARLAPPMPPA